MMMMMMMVMMIIAIIKLTKPVESSSQLPHYTACVSCSRPNLNMKVQPYCSDEPCPQNSPLPTTLPSSLPDGSLCLPATFNKGRGGQCLGNIRVANFPSVFRTQTQCPSLLHITCTAPLPSCFKSFNSNRANLNAPTFIHPL
jgi:hypothetical protein